MFNKLLPILFSGCLLVNFNCLAQDISANLMIGSWACSTSDMDGVKIGDFKVSIKKNDANSDPNALIFTENGQSKAMIFKALTETEINRDTAIIKMKEEFRYISDEQFKMIIESGVYLNQNDVIDFKHLDVICDRVKQ